MEFGEVSQTQFAALVNLSVVRVGQLVKEGVIPLSKRRKVPMIEGNHAYIAFVRKENKSKTKTAATQANVEARTKVLDLRIARERGELIPMERAEAAVIGQCAHFRVGLDSLPAQLSRDFSERKRIEAQIDVMLAELARDTRERAATLASDRDSLDASEEDDAG